MLSVRVCDEKIKGPGEKARKKEREGGRKGKELSTKRRSQILLHQGFRILLTRKI